MSNPYPCMICGKNCSSVTYMGPPLTVYQVHSQLREKKFMEITAPDLKPKPLRRGKQGIARRDGPEPGLF
jgi:hypothetical protein